MLFLDTVSYEKTLRADMCMDPNGRSMIWLDRRVSRRVGSMISVDPIAKFYAGSIIS